MLRRGLAWSITVPLAVLGSQLAHAVAYRAAEPDAARRAELLASTGHGYLQHWPLALAVGTVVIAVAFAADVAGRLRGASGPRLRPLHFAAIAPAVFACQEILERAVESHTLPLAALGDRTFIVGLALQLPFALAAYAVARLLLRVARALVARLAPPRAALRGARALPRPRLGLVPPVFSPALALGTRGPPAVR